MEIIVSRSKNPESYCSVAAQTPLFLGISEETIGQILTGEGITVRHFERGEILCGRERFLQSVGFLVIGRASVMKGECDMLMSVLHAGELFGAASLFDAGDRYVATITALESTWAVLIPEDRFRRILAKYPKVNENYLRYLTCRIRFLSDRIDGLAEGSTEDRVYRYICKNASNGVFAPEYSISRIGDALRISRTTLYRAIAVLEQEGKIRKDGRIFRLAIEEGGENK